MSIGEKILRLVSLVAERDECNENCSYEAAYICYDKSVAVEEAEKDLEDSIFLIAKKAVEQEREEA